MPIAISDDHQALAETAADLLESKGALAEARRLLDGAEPGRPSFWDDLASVGWLGLHLPESVGGSGYGLEELVIVAEAMGQSVAPGPFIPTVIASAALAAAGESEGAAAHLPGLADGTSTGSIALLAEATLADGRLSGSAVAQSAEGAGVILVPVGADLALVDPDGEGVSLSASPSLDVARPAHRLTFDGAPVTVLPGAASTTLAIARTILAAEAAGLAQACTTAAAEYAKERQQFGRPIAMFQGVKHHCANMAVAAELTTSAVWDAARAADAGGDQFAYAAAAAAALAGPAADLCANLSTQVHGGIAITWEHDAHLFMRRATTLKILLESERAATDLTDLVRSGVERTKAIELPPEAEALRDEVKAFTGSLAELSADDQTARLIEAGYAMPHWPTPYGRAAGAVEQLVIEEEFAAAGISKPSYGITGWVILTLIQYGTADQIERWIMPAMRQELIWCQLFSEPDAGSDAAGVTTKATRVDGGWLVNGQKVWTSGTHEAAWGFATVRTDPDAKKHDGITMVVVDMHAEGVEVRPIKMTTGESEFNEVFFNDVFVPDDDVVGPVNGGWTVARATLGNESVSIGSGDGGMSMPPSMMVPAFDANPERLAGGAARIGRYAAEHQAMSLLNLRSAHRAVAGGQPGPEGAMTKLVLSELLHEAAALLTALNGPDALFMDGEASLSNILVLMHRGMSIAGGTSEIKRNQIGERILGLPRDPLLK